MAGILESNCFLNSLQTSITYLITYPLYSHLQMLPLHESFEITVIPESDVRTLEISELIYLRDSNGRDGGKLGVSRKHLGSSSGHTHRGYGTT